MVLINNYLNLMHLADFFLRLSKSKSITYTLAIFYYLIFLR